METKVFLWVDQIPQIHAKLILQFGGDPGLGDRGLLESAVAMPKSVYGGNLLHESLEEKAAAYLFHLCSNHPFLDGNKRVAVAAAEVFLLVNDHELLAKDEELEELTLGVVRGERSKEEVIAFFKQHVCKAGSKGGIRGKEKPPRAGG